MPLLAKATKALTDRLPKVISPGAHAIIDYASAGLFFAAAAAFWKRSRTAAVSSMICGSSQLLLAVMTDYPGGIVRKVGFRAHGKLDGGFAIMTASLPEFMSFADRKEAKFFDVQAMNLAAVAGLTDFTGSGEPGQMSRLEDEAA